MQQTLTLRGNVKKKYCGVLEQRRRVVQHCIDIIVTTIYNSFSVFWVLEGLYIFGTTSTCFC